MHEANDSSNTANPYAATCDFLYALRNQGSKYGLERMQAFLTRLKNPHERFPLIHVAGTNGKGSVCAMLEALYRDNGYRTGLFTSPHLLHLGERIQVNRQALDETAITEYTDHMRPLAETLAKENPELGPTFFEYMAAMAMLHFAESKVDLACIETGLGGRLDATNVVDPELSIITSIGLDHCDLLGDTLGAIAREKGGIIKPGKPVLFGFLPIEAEAELRAIAKERQSPVYALAERFPDPEALPETNLHGSFQRHNAALALYATEILQERFPITKQTALHQVNWQGRWQTIALPDRNLILDATHNAEGATYLTENLQQFKEKPIIIAGTMGEERGRSLIEAVAPHARELILVEPNQPRATSTQCLRQYLPENYPIPVRDDTVAQLFPSKDCCTAGEPGATVLVTGSIYLIGEILSRIQGLPASDQTPHLQDRL
jgi:dihydrofolate synthase/folylpolyglutamate synthase